MTGDNTRVDEKHTILAVVVLLAMLIATIVLLGVQAEHVWLGWLYFLCRTLPRITVDWLAAILGTVASFVMVVSIHRTLVWLHALRGKEKSVWQWRSSVAAAGSLLLLFAAGTAMVGATHQLVWLVTGRAATRTESDSTELLGLVHNAQQAARTGYARHALRNFGLALHNYHDVFGCLPPGGTMTEQGQLLHGWSAMAGPYLSIQSDQLQPHVPWNQAPNQKLLQCQLHCFVNPAIEGSLFDTDGYGLSHWAGNVHVLPIQRTTQSHSGQHTEGMTFDEITDGLAHTILLGSVTTNLKPWGHPANVRDPSLGINRSPDGFGGPPDWNGAMFLMCDGSVRMLSADTSLPVMRALATPAGAEKVSHDFYRSISDEHETY